LATFAKKAVTNLRVFLEDTGFYRVPLTKLATGHYKLEAKVNNVFGSFILDTGASTSCIGFESAEKFELESETSDIKAAGAGAINMSTKISKTNTFFIKKWQKHAIDFVLFDLSHVNQALAQVDEMPVDGILGADLLKKHKAVIDYGRNCLYIK